MFIKYKKASMLFMLTALTTFSFAKIPLWANESSSIEYNGVMNKIVMQSTPTIDDFSISNVTSDSVAINWEISESWATITNLSLIYTSDSSVVASTTTPTLTGVTTIDGLTPQTTYSWKLVLEYETRGSVNTIETDPIVFSTTKVAPVINEFDVTRLTRKSVVVHWDISDPDSTITKIKLYDLNDNKPRKTFDENSGTQTIKRLTKRKRYHWQLVVEYNDDSGTSVVKSDPVVFKTADAMPIIDAFSVTSISDTEAQIYWDITDEDLVAFKISVFDIDANSTIWSEEDFPYTGSAIIDGLSQTTTYNWKFVVDYKDGYYLQTVESEVAEFETPLPSPVINSFDVELINDTSVNVIWNLSDNSGTITKATLFDDFSGTSILESESPALSGSVVIDTLSPNVEYDWRLIVEYNNSIKDTFVQTNAIQFITNDADPTINNFNVAPLDNSSAEVTWDVSDNGTSIDSMDLIDANTRMIVDDVIIDSTTGSAIVPNLDSETTYDWELLVRYNNGVYDDSLESTDTEFTTGSKANPLVNDFNIEVNSSSSVNVNWDITDNDSTLTDLKLIDSNTGSIIEESTTPATTGTKTIYNLDSNTTYNWELVADYDNDVTASSIETTTSAFTTLKATPLIADFDVKQIDDSIVEINWNIDDVDSAITNAQVINTDTGEVVYDLISNEGSIVIEGLPIDEILSWQLIIDYNDGSIDSQVTSDIVTFQAVKPPLVPTFYIITTMVILLMLILLGTTLVTMIRRN